MLLLLLALSKLRLSTWIWTAFVAVVMRNCQDLMDKPVAVSHSDSPKGRAEISSANYPARDYGVKAGMFVRDAKARGPHLLIVPYNFEAYEEVADLFYNILHRNCNKVQAVSSEDAFLDANDSGVKDPELLASLIRKMRSVRLQDALQEPVLVETYLGLALPPDMPNQMVNVEYLLRR